MKVRKQSLSENDIEKAQELARRIYAFHLSSDKSMAEHQPGEGEEETINHAIEEARETLENPRARSAICAALGSASKSLNETVKIVAASILPLHLTGVLVVSLTPVYLAAVSAVIFSVGISAYCAEN